LAQSTEPADLPELQTQIGRVAEELDGVIEELREISRGIPRSCPRAGRGSPSRDRERSARPMKPAIHHQVTENEHRDRGQHPPQQRRASAARLVPAAEADLDDLLDGLRATPRLFAGEDGNRIRSAVRDAAARMAWLGVQLPELTEAEMPARPTSARAPTPSRSRVGRTACRRSQPRQRTARRRPPATGWAGR
jgi:hypothetical protein